MPNYRILVMTSDKYNHALKSFSWLANKYWVPNPMYVVSGFSNLTFRLPENFSFVSVGDQRDFPFQKWSDALYITLTEHFTDDVFVLMLEDYWLTRPVNEHAIALLVDYARDHPDVMKIDITADRLFAHGVDMRYGTLDYLDLIRSDPQSQYHMSLMPGIWRRDNLLNFLIPGESPHDIELEGTTRLREMSHLQVIGTRQWPVRVNCAMRGQKPGELLVDEMAQDDVLALKKLGFFKGWGINA